MRFTLLFMLVLIICSCEPQRTQEPPVAQVFESTLSRSEIIDFIPNGTSSEDSLLMAQNKNYFYIKRSRTYPTKK